MDQMLIQALRNKNSLCENSTVNVCEKFTWYHCHDQLISQNGNIGSDSVFPFWILGLLVLFTTCTTFAEEKLYYLHVLQLTFILAAH